MLDAIMTSGAAIPALITVAAFVWAGWVGHEYNYSGWYGALPGVFAFVVALIVSLFAWLFFALIP